MKEIELTQGQFAIVDDEDYNFLVMTKWYAIFDKNTKTYRAHGAAGLLMHRIIMKAKKGEIVDHKNHNTLDNRKENLRIVTASQNMMNRKRNNRKNGLPKGVRMRGQKFRSSIDKDGKTFELGTFLTAKEAGVAYDKKARELFGEFAKLNFPECEK